MLSSDVVYGGIYHIPPGTTLRWIQSSRKVPPMANSKPELLQDSVFENKSDRDIEFLIPVNEKVRVSYDQKRFSYEAFSSEQEQISVVLSPGDAIEVL